MGRGGYRWVRISKQEIQRAHKLLIITEELMDLLRNSCNEQSNHLPGNFLEN